MKLSSTENSLAETESKLHIRDWILLPLISLATILLMAVCTEFIARRLFPVSQVHLENCFVVNDASGNAPAKPNSVCSERTAENSFPIEYRFNSRGNRENGELLTKPPSTYRIVLIGSSFAMGLFVPRDMSFAALLPVELSQRTGRKIELYNEASGGKFRGGAFPTDSSVLHFEGVFSTAPDIILWVITPKDIENAVPAAVAVQGAPLSGKEQTSPSNIWSKLKIAFVDGSFWNRLHSRWENSRTSVMLQHFLLANDSQDQYVESSLENGDESDFLKNEPSEKWQHSFQIFQTDAIEFEKLGRAKGVPIVAVLLPNRTQAAFLCMNKPLVGYDPYKLDREVRTIVESHGGTFIDILPDFCKIPNPERYYFPVDGHLDVEGHAMISDLLAKGLANSGIAEFRVAISPQTVTTQGR